MAGLRILPDTERLAGRAVPGVGEAAPGSTREGGRGNPSSLPASVPEALAASPAAKGPAPHRQQRETFPQASTVLGCAQGGKVIWGPSAVKTGVGTRPGQPSACSTLGAPAAQQTTARPGSVTRRTELDWGLAQQKGHNYGAGLNWATSQRSGRMEPSQMTPCLTPSPVKWGERIQLRAQRGQANACLSRPCSGERGRGREAGGQRAGPPAIPQQWRFLAQTWL